MCNKMTELEKCICNAYSKKYGIFTGNGTTAMYIAFKALNLQDKKVLFPSISCTNPINAAIFAGYEVDFCDVNLNDYTIDVEEMEKKIKTGEYGIVVPTHIYGHRYREHCIYEVCKKYNVIVFEDAAQSFFVGESDLSVISFGHTKVCETNLGGGMIFSDNKDWLEAMKDEKKNLLKLSSNGYKVGFDEYRRQYYKIVKDNIDIESRNAKLKQLQLKSYKYFLYDLDENKDIIEKLEKKNVEINNRREKVKVYEALIDKKYVNVPDISDYFRWRYTFLYNGDRDGLLEKVRENGIDISSWYFSLSQIYCNEKCMNANIVENNVVNLWVDETHSISQIKREIKIINEIMRTQNE